MIGFNARLICLLLAVLSLGLWRAQGHGNVHELIQALTLEISTNKNNPDLYLRRAELHRAHQDWDSAYADYATVERLDPKMVVVDLGRGKMFLDANWPQSAIIALDRLLAVHTNSAEGFATRARARAKLGQRLDAVKDYTSAIGYSVEPRPELYLERAQALIGEGEKYFDEALRGLDEGMTKLGPLVTLQLYAIDVELKKGRFDEAIARLDRVAAQSPRKETWLARRGEILQQARRMEEARKAYSDALAALDKLPPTRRNVPAMQELEKRIRAAIESTKVAGTNAPIRKP